MLKEINFNVLARRITDFFQHTFETEITIDVAKWTEDDECIPHKLDIIKTSDSSAKFILHSPEGAEEIGEVAEDNPYHLSISGWSMMWELVGEKLKDDWNNWYFAYSDNNE